jgi:hypothetical protein
MPIGSSRKGCKHSKHKKGYKLSYYRKMPPRTEEHRHKLSESLKKNGKPKNWDTLNSPENNKKRSESLRGKNSPFWKGGKSFEEYSFDWTETLKRSIRERDNYICRLCLGYVNEVHHIDYNKKNCNPNNLIVLCHNCHIKTNFNRDNWSELLGKYIYLNQLLEQK